MLISTFDFPLRMQKYPTPILFKQKIVGFDQNRRLTILLNIFFVFLPIIRK